MNLRKKLLTTLLLSASAFMIQTQAETHPVKQAPAVRAAALYAPDYTRGQEGVWGFELGYASPIFPFENMSFSWGHISSNDIQHNYFLLNFEDSYRLIENVYLVGGSGLGVILADEKPGPDKEAALGRLSVGFRYDACSAVSLFADANFLIASKDVFLDGRSHDNKTWQYLIGLQYRF
ncbi:MAG: hypothetical protein JJU05_12160 [Verrucomicrobia bacterium]|nr:hypothetical protein [Verrucomicrobiota bacterium]MCH8527304.1 hypothetical protein [Kiritimatiellia bacterium]